MTTWYVYECSNGKWEVTDSVGCFLTFNSEIPARMLCARLNEEKIYSKGILPDWIDEYI